MFVTMILFFYLKKRLKRNTRDKTIVRILMEDEPMNPICTVLLAILALLCALVLVGAMILGVCLLLVQVASRIAEWINRKKGDNDE